MIDLYRDIVCYVCGVGTDELSSRKKSRHIVEARAVFYRLCMDAGISNKEAMMFMGRSIQSSRIYEDILAGCMSENFTAKLKRCRTVAQLVMYRYKKSSAVHPITTYTKAEELMIMKATISAQKFMERYCATSV